MIRYTLTAIVVALGAFSTQPSLGQEAPAATDSSRTWTDHASLQDRLRTLAKSHPGDVTIEEIGTSIEGREIYALRLARSGDVDADSRPAILLVAGIDASMPHTSECAADVASLPELSRLLVRDNAPLSVASYKAVLKLQSARPALEVVFTTPPQEVLDECSE